MQAAAIIGVVQKRSATRTLTGCSDRRMPVKSCDAATSEDAQSSDG